MEEGRDLSHFGEGSLVMKRENLSLATTSHRYIMFLSTPNFTSWSDDFQVSLLSLQGTVTTIIFFLFLFWRIFICLVHFMYKITLVKQLLELLFIVKLNYVPEFQIGRDDYSLLESYPPRTFSFQPSLY